MRYPFITEYQHDSSMTTMCRVLDVSVSRSSAWRKRVPSQHARSDAPLAQPVKAAFPATGQGYGSPRVHAELRAQGLHCARKRVARLMREQGLLAKRPCHRTITTKSKPGAHVAPNLLQRGFSADQPHQQWVADTTSIWTAEGWLYLAGVLDLVSRMGSDGLWRPLRMPRWWCKRSAWPSLVAFHKQGYAITPIVAVSIRARAIKHSCGKRG